MVNPSGGYLCARLKYYRGKEKKTQPIPDDESETDTPPNVMRQNDHNTEMSGATSAIQNLNLGDNQMESVVDSESLQRNIVRNLRSMVVNEGNMHFIKEMLFKTLDFRAKMARDEKIEFRVEFPYFYTNPELVPIFQNFDVKLHKRPSFSHLLCNLQIQYDFEIRNPSIEKEAFQNFWTTHNGNLRRILTLYYSSYDVSTSWPPEIENFFILQRLFPVKKASAEVFIKAMDKLMIFRTVQFELNFILMVFCQGLFLNMNIYFILAWGYSRWYACNHGGQNKQVPAYNCIGLIADRDRSLLYHYGTRVNRCRSITFFLL